MAQRSFYDINTFFNINIIGAYKSAKNISNSSSNGRTFIFDHSMSASLLERQPLAFKMIHQSLVELASI